jgi:hypothetical protein
MSTKSVKAIELIFDWNLWPRHKAEVLDRTNLNQLKEALKAGLRFPAIVVNEKDLRIIDGFHRTKAVLEVYGDEGTIDAEMRHYKDEQEMFLEAGALNNHGLKLGPIDRAFFIDKARRMKIPPEAIATAIGMDSKKMMEFLKKRSAKTENGHTIILPAGARNLAGKVLSESQEHFARTANGCLPEMYARMLLNALRADALTIDEKTMKLLAELHEEIGEILLEAGK